MLYVFHVDVGRMLNFDMTVALSSVENLKDTIERLHGIPAANIVLLVSGGEMLTHSTQVSCYSAGTDTNPIYMFLTGDLKLPAMLAAVEADINLREQVESSLELPANYETVASRAQLAQRMHDLARDEERMCERLVHEQHLQQQGWSAVVANMEDLTEEFRHRFRNFCDSFNRHLDKRGAYLELLRNFTDDLSKLSRIPILPGLMPLAEADFHGFDEYLDNDEVFSRSTNQQESVVMTAKKANAAEASDDVVAESNAAQDDKNISSTSPNKKLKMANDSTEAAERNSQTSQTSSTSNTTRRSLNLLQWITSKENHNVLKTMSDECIQGLATFNEEVYEKLKMEVQNIIKLAEQSDVKEIKGLGERLCKLEEFKYKIKNMVKDQKELSTAFQQNQNRALNLRDASILPDLCASHQSQLLVMLQNHQKIRDHRRCIAKAKDELGGNLHTRLKRIVFIENAMSEFDNRLLFYHRCLRRAERHIHIIEQIHQAPNMYVAAVTEVMRRKIFSTEFRLWASKLAEDFDGIHSEEMKRRQQFNVNFEGHFLNILFPGLNDMPPAFANENPLIFDVRLPNITRSDIDILTTHLPEMAARIQLPDMEPVIYFFVSRSGAHQRERFEQLLKQKQKQNIAADGEEEEEDDEELKASGNEEQSSSSGIMQTSGKMPEHPRLRELKKESGNCEESETDTETEFEQVQANLAQSVATSTMLTLTMTRSTTTERLLMQSAETLTEENSEALRAEVTQMRAMLGAMSKLALECIHLARSNLQTFRQETTAHQEDLQSELQTLNDKWNVLRMQCEAREQELAEQRANREHEVMVLSASLKQKDAELEEQKEQMQEMTTMRIKCATLEAQLDELKDKQKSHEFEKEAAVSEAREKLIHEHKTELESLRQRFKLMTSMERSPSDLSLEAVEHPATSNDNLLERTYHETIIAQLKNEWEAEKEKAIKAAIESERSIWQSKIFPLNSESVMANVSVLKEMLEDKERQLDQLREKDIMLTKENYQLKTRLDALTNEEGNSWLKEKIDYLNRDKNRLEEELNMEKSRRLEMETSFANIKGSAYEPCPLPARTKSSSTTVSGSSHKLIVFESCAKGDMVFVVWSMRHQQFMVVQDSASLYFVHGDSLADLNLRLPPASSGDEHQIPMPYYAIGKVIEKEYCQAKKDENRYRVNKGSKFYRIKIAPLVSRQPLRRERLESFSTSFSRSCDSHSGEASATCSVPPAASHQITASAIGISPATAASSSSPLAICAMGKDVTDMPIATSPITVITTTATQALSQSNAGLAFKERTISITSVVEEDDEPAVSLLSERCRYISVSEEDENFASCNVTSVPAIVLTATGSSSFSSPSATDHNTTTITTAMTTSSSSSSLTAIATQTTVITEQPTATASKLEMDLMLASADINTNTNIPIIYQQQQQQQQQHQQHVDNNNYELTYTTPEIVVSSIPSYAAAAAAGATATTTMQTSLTVSSSTSAAISIPNTQSIAITESEALESCDSTAVIPTSIGTNTSEDSDDYKSLEAKEDEHDFPISE